METTEIELYYEPRPLWNDVIHPALERYRFAVIVAHRRYGKTVGMVNELIRKAVNCDKPSPQYVYLAPFRNQAKRIAWNYLKHYTAQIPQMKVNESELYVEFPSQVKDRVGARIYLMGADNPNALRGMYFDGIVLDEYAQHPANLWGEVLRSSIAERGGFAYIIGTPRGQNQFYETYQKAVNNPEWFTCVYRVDETNVLPEAEVESMKRDMTDIEIRQELYCDFTASSGNVVIPIDVVTEAAHRKIIGSDVRYEPIVMGVDVARYGGDRSVIFWRQGRLLNEPVICIGLDNMEVAARAASVIAKIKPCTVFIDAGQGTGVIDRLRALGFQGIIEVPFGSKAQDDRRYENIRAEMYFKARDWLMSGGAIPNNTDLKAELTATEYKFSRAGRIMLEPKEETKKKIGKSPDLADAFVLTFALPVTTKPEVRRTGKARDYDPLKHI